MVDPMLVMAEFGKLLVSPLCDELYFDRGGLSAAVLRLYDAVRVPDLRKHRTAGGAAVARGLTDVVTGALERGKNIIFYPGGHIWTEPDPHEEIGTRQLAYNVCCSLFSEQVEGPRSKVQSPKSKVQCPMSKVEGQTEGTRSNVEGPRSKVKGQTEEGKIPLSDLSPLTSDLTSQTSQTSPAVRIIGVRTLGLWGSMWSRKGRKRTPSFGSTLAKAIGLWLVCLVTRRRRKVTMHFEDITDRVREWSALPRLEFNKQLEAWYNADGCR